MLTLKARSVNNPMVFGEIKLKIVNSRYRNVQTSRLCRISDISANGVFEHANKETDMLRASKDCAFGYILRKY